MEVLTTKGTINIGLHDVIIKINKIFSLFIPKQDIEESNNNIPANREAMHDYYEDLNNPH